MEIRVYSKLTVRGPIKTPTGPKSEIPPKTANKIRSGGMFILLLKKSGLRKLSTIPTIIIDQIKKPMAEAVLPIRKRKMKAGIETRAVPIIGIKEAIAATTPQSAGCGTLKKERP